MIDAVAGGLLLGSVALGYRVMLARANRRYQELYDAYCQLERERNT